MKFKGLTLRNFMSTGQVTQAVSLDADTLTLILGENRDLGSEGSGHRNGVGKTVLLNALSFALFGNAITNIKKDNLINLINKKNMLVTLDFEKNGTQYRIERGRKPNVMRFMVNGTEVDPSDDSQGDSRETQKAIESLIGMTPDMFKHIITLNTYTEPFLAMKAADQRDIIEQLLGMTILSEKAEALKVQIKNTKDEIFRETAKLDAIKTANDNIQNSINALKQRQKAWNQRKNDDVDSFVNAINSLSTVDIDAEIANHQSNSTTNELLTNKRSFDRELTTLRSTLLRTTSNIDKLGKELLSIADKKCPTCLQGLNDHNHNDMIANTTKSLEDALAIETTQKQDIAILEAEVDKLGTIPAIIPTFYKTITEAYNHKNNLQQLTNQLESKYNEADTYREQIDELSTSAIQELDWSIVNSLTSMKDHQEFLLKLLTNKDSYIRKKIIDQNLSYLNNRLAHYLDKLGLPHNVEFKNDLSVEITQLGQDLDFHNLSRGEMNRLIIGLSLSFRDVWESLYEPINLLIVDELIDNGTDSSGVSNGMNTLNHIAHERGKNVFIISHRDELMTKCDNILKVIKSNGFTSYELNTNS
jgi:DNA repair exonuclease SbcCD ATPase subunit